MYVTDVVAQERDKYAEIWTTVPEYRDYSPGLVNVDRFMSVMKPEPMSTVIDIGCGTGAAGFEMERRGMQVSYTDITDAAFDAIGKRFFKSPLWEDWGCHNRRGWDYGFCCDVLEHIPTEYTMLCIDRIVQNCRTSWLQIALRPDEFGKAIGQPLHLTVQPFLWWLHRISTLCEVVDARDLCGDGLYVVRRR